MAHSESCQQLPNKSFYIDQADETRDDFELTQERKIKTRKKKKYNKQNYTIPTATVPLYGVDLPVNRLHITKDASMQEKNKISNYKIITNLSSESPNSIPLKHNLKSYKNINQNNFVVCRCGMSYDNSKKCRCGMSYHNTENVGKCGCSLDSEAMCAAIQELYSCLRKQNRYERNCAFCYGEQTGISISLRRRMAVKESLRSLICKLKGKPCSILTSKEISKLHAHLKARIAEQKEKILIRYAKTGIPLPEGETKSEQCLIIKVRRNIGLPPEPRTKHMREKYIKATNAGLIVPLEGKSSREKLTILRALNRNGIPLPKGRTPSEKSLIDRIRLEPPILIMIRPSHKMRAAQSEELFEPIKGKTPSKQEQILRCHALNCNMLPEGKSKSEKNLLKRIRFDLGLPPEPKCRAMRCRYAKVADAGLLHPLEGKSRKEKISILRALYQVGIPLPKARTPSEKFIIRKIKGEPVRQKFKMKAKGNSPEIYLRDKENILKNLCKAAQQLTEGKTHDSQRIKRKCCTHKVCSREKMQKATAAGFWALLKSRRRSKNANIFTRLMKTAVAILKDKTKLAKTPTTENKQVQAGRTISRQQNKIAREKCDILNSVYKNRSCFPLDTRAMSEKTMVKKAKTVTWKPCTSFAEIKPPKKEQLFRDLIKPCESRGGKTLSKNELITNICKDIELKTPTMKKKPSKAISDGINPSFEGLRLIKKEKGRSPPKECRCISEKPIIKKSRESVSTKLTSEMVSQAEDEGLRTPLKRKPSTKKEEILNGQPEYQLPLLKDVTSSEYILIKRTQGDYNLFHKHMTSLGKEVATQSTPEIIDTHMGNNISPQKNNIKGKLDHGVHCDMKRITFKHNYNENNITSPDILPTMHYCPYECMADVKEVFVCQKGVNIKFGRMKEIQNNPINIIHDKGISNIIYNNASTYTADIIFDNNNNKRNTGNHLHREPSLNCNHTLVNSSLYDQNQNNSLNGIRNKMTSSKHDFNDDTIKTNSNRNSFDSTWLIRSESSLTSSRSYKNFRTTNDDYSIDINFAASYVTMRDVQHSLSIANFINRTSNEVSYCDKKTSRSKYVTQHSANNIRKEDTFMNRKKNKQKQHYQISTTKINNIEKTKPNVMNGQTEEPNIAINNINSDMILLIDDLLSDKEFSQPSSLFMIVPTAYEENKEIYNNSFNLCSTQYIYLSQISNICQTSNEEVLCSSCNRESFITKSMKMSLKRMQREVEKNPVKNPQMQDAESWITMNKNRRLRRRTVDVTTDTYEDTLSWFSSIPDKSEVRVGPQCGRYLVTKEVMNKHRRLRRRTVDPTSRDVTTDTYEDTLSWFSSIPDKSEMRVGPQCGRYLVTKEDYNVYKSKLPTTHHVQQAPLSTSTIAKECPIRPTIVSSKELFRSSLDNLAPYDYLVPQGRELGEIIEEIFSPEEDRQLFEEMREAGDVNHEKNMDSLCTVQTEDYTSESTARPSRAVRTWAPENMAQIRIVDQDCPICYKPKPKNDNKTKYVCATKKKVRIKPTYLCEELMLPKRECQRKLKKRPAADHCSTKDNKNKIIEHMGQKRPRIRDPSIITKDCIIQVGSGPMKSTKKLQHSPKPKRRKRTHFYNQTILKTEKTGEREICKSKGGYVIIGSGGMYSKYKL